MRELLRDRIYAAPATRDAVVREFHRLYYDSWHHLNEPTLESRWLGHKALKCPLDLWVYQEILHEIRPDLVIECGTYEGGSALYLASVLSLFGDHVPGQVVSIDVAPKPDLPTHPRLRFVTGSSTSPGVVGELRPLVQQAERVLVFLDSDHARDHVRRELGIYSDFVTPGSYLIIEDTNVNGHPVHPNFGPGPMEAVLDFLAEDPRYEADRSRERFLLTMNPHGFLKRVR
jgi:cephalosporin hydroxylase